MKELRGTHTFYFARSNGKLHLASCMIESAANFLRFKKKSHPPGRFISTARDAPISPFGCEISLSKHRNISRDKLFHKELPCVYILNVRVVQIYCPVL